MAYVSHITLSSVSTAQKILVPVLDREHWTLLVGLLQERTWEFYDSLPIPTHKAILPGVVSIGLARTNLSNNSYFLWTLISSYGFGQMKALYADTGHAFDSDITTWPIVPVTGLPVQANSVDCGMYVCKYMETVAKPEEPRWEEKKNWQGDMPKFRAELAYAILCASKKDNKFC